VLGEKLCPGISVVADGLLPERPFRKYPRYPAIKSPRLSTIPEQPIETHQPRPREIFVQDVPVLFTTQVQVICEETNPLLRDLAAKRERRERVQRKSQEWLKAVATANADIITATASTGHL